MSRAPFSPAPIPWHRRIEVRVVAGVSVLVGFSLVAALIAVSHVVTTRSLAVASDTLEAAHAAFDVLVQRRIEFAAAQTRLITELPVFRAHISDARLARDGPTLDAMVDEYRQRLGAQFCVLTDRDGQWMSSPGWPVGQPPPAGIHWSIAAAVHGQPHHEVLSIDRHQLVIIVSEPARFADEVLGTFTVGYTLDDADATELEQVTHCEVSLVSDDYVSGTSLTGPGRAALVDLLAARRQQPHQSSAVEIQSLGGRRYVTGDFPLSAGDASNTTDRLLLLQDWQPTQRFLDELRNSFLRAGGLIFLFTVGAGIVFSRWMTRPFQDIAAAAGDIAAGNWTREVSIRGSAESTTMAVAFNQMSTHLRHWQQEAHDRSARLQASYERFSSVTDSARDAIVSTDRDGVVRFWSKSASSTFGYDEEAAIGESLTRFVAPCDRDACLAALGSFGAGQNGPESGRTIEVMGAHRDGGHFPIELSVSTWQSSGAIQFTAVVRNITERKRAEAELRGHDDEIQRQRLRVFKATMRTVQDIVNNLLNGVQLVQIEAEGQLPAELRALLDHVTQDAAVRVKALGDLETVQEKDMAIGPGIEYPGSTS